MEKIPQAFVCLYTTGCIVKFFNRLSHDRKVAAAAGFALIGAICVGVMVFRSFIADASVSSANTRWFVCAETLKAYKVDLGSVDTIPAPSPYSGKNTGYPAELCYWNADGTAKTEPTPVLLNANKNDPAPTFCPDCGRLVVGRNPMPGEGVRPPPTRAEYETWMKSRGMK